jgi:hypothetical protein
MREFRKNDYILFFGVFIFLVWIFLVLPPLSLYSNDEGAKYVQMKNFYLNKSLAIKYPGEKLGLGLESLLKDQAMFAERGGKMYCTYPPLFTYLSSLFYPFLGDRTTHFLPLLAFFLSLIILSRTLKLLIKDTFLHYLLLFTFLLGSPIFMYAFTFWEHLPAVFAVVCSLYFLVKYFYVKASKLNLFLSVIILSFAALFRTEILFLVLAYIISFGFILYNRGQLREIAFLIIGAMLPLMANLIFNLINYHHPWIHILYNSPNFQFSIKRSIFLFGIILSCFALVFIYKKDKLDSVLKKEIYSFVPILLLWFVLVVFECSPIIRLFYAFPAALFMFFGFSKRIVGLKNEDMAFGNLLLGTVIFFILLVSYFLYNNPDLSVRYCLPIIPFIIVFIASENKRIFITKSIYGVLIVFFIFSLGYGLHNFKNDIWRYKWFNTKRIEFLKKYTHDGDVVIFQDQRLMEHAGPLFFERIYLVSDELAELTKLFNLLKEKGINYCFLWTIDPNYVSQQWEDKTIRIISRYKFSNCCYLLKVFII